MADDPDNDQPVGSNYMCDKFNTAYFYYIDYRHGRKVKAYEYFDPKNPIKHVDVLTLSLLANALNDGSCPPCYCENITDLIRRRKGYIIIAIEGRKFKKCDPLTFTLSHSNCNDGDITGSSAGHTFWHLGNFEIKLHTRDFSVCVYVNKMQSSSGCGDLRPNECEEFTVSVNFEDTEVELGEYSSPYAAGGPDSGGTNMGPPPPPP